MIPLWQPPKPWYLGCLFGSFKPPGTAVFTNRGFYSMFFPWAARCHPQDANGYLDDSWQYGIIFLVIKENDDNLLSGREIEHVLKCLEEYHRKSSNIHVTNLISVQANPRANLAFQR